jgi:L-alanine-DL-glutamate epimerase-like enolase superfamily enzyme
MHRGATCSACSLAGAAVAFETHAATASTPFTIVVNDMKLRFYPYTLELRHTFTIATSSRTTTPTMMVEVEGRRDWLRRGVDAAVLGESQASADAFLKLIDMSKFPDPFQLDGVLHAIDAIATGNTAAKAAVDIALHDWVGKKFGQPWHRIWGLDASKTPVTSFTIGIDTADVVRADQEASIYKVSR